jgi:ABC-type nickel/cobalt efflux system permease component RcnA
VTRSSRPRTDAIGASALVAALVLVAPPVMAHPLGNFSISHYSGFRLEERSVELHYILDLAEIPTFQEIQETGVVPDPDHPSVAAYARGKAEALKAGLHAEVGERRLAFEPQATQVIFPPGAGGLPTLKIGIRYRAALPEDGPLATLSYRDTNYGDRAGWKEIVATREPGIVFIESSVPETDRSRQLADYPADLLNSPPQDVEARITFKREQPVTAAPTSAPRSPTTLALEPSRPSTPRDRFTELVTVAPESPHLVLLALLIAAGLGAFHALEPGHGKTMVAAYLVGTRGTAGHAVLLGLIVTAAHTAGVYLLGAMTLYASRYFVPERIYPWLGVVSGLTIAGLGLSLLYRRYRGTAPHHHDDHNHQEHSHAHDLHSPPHEHHQTHGHPHPHGHHHAHGDVTPRQLFTLGVTGGIIPCPAALVVLLSGLSLGRVGFGLVLIVAFSLGLAAVLIITGLLMVFARSLMARVQGDGALVSRWLPLTSSAVITIIGLAIVLQSGAAWTRP